VARRVLLWGAATAIAVTLAAAGVALYARNPDVGTYWLNFLLIAPLLFTALYGLHLVLPLPAQWAIAGVIAPLGPIAYLLWPNAQVWNYGALTAIPLVLLACERQERMSKHGEITEHWYGGSQDGPWGPP